MPASQFFAMLEAKRELESAELIRASYIARSSATSDAGFNELIASFRIPEKQVKKKEPEPTFKASTEDARNAVRMAFGKDTRLNREMVH